MSRGGPAAVRLRQLCLLVASWALVPAASRAWEPPIPPAAEPRLGAEPSADPSVTNRSCTEQTLLSGVPCLIEGELAGRADGLRVNELERLATAMGERTCARAARTPGDPQAEAAGLAACRRELSRAAKVCAAHETPLLDGEGRFTPGTGPCYSALGDALATARTAVAATRAARGSGGPPPGAKPESTPSRSRKAPTGNGGPAKEFAT